MEITWRHDNSGKELIKEIKTIKNIYIIVVEVLRESAQTGSRQRGERFTANCSSALTKHNTSAFYKGDIGPLAGPLAFMIAKHLVNLTSHVDEAAQYFSLSV